MSNIAGKAYAMNVVTPSKPWRTWVNRLIFMAARGLPDRLGGLLGLSLIHFARWVIIKRDQWPDLGQGRQALQNDYVLFCSNFNGTWDQYIDAFSDGIPNGLDLFWYSATKYPHSIPVTSFKDYITFNQVYTDYYYNATPGSAQRDLKCAMRVYDAIAALAAQYPDTDPTSFAAAYRAQLGKIQGCLGDPGFGPVASLDTERADLHRAARVKAQTRAFDAARKAPAEPTTTE
jgi:hypothetical protein